LLLLLLAVVPLPLGLPSMAIWLDCLSPVFRSLLDSLSALWARSKGGQLSLNGGSVSKTFSGSEHFCPSSVWNHFSLPFSSLGSILYITWTVFGLCIKKVPRKRPEFSGTQFLDFLLPATQHCQSHLRQRKVGEAD
jgi:hypothetical protein